MPISSRRVPAYFLFGFRELPSHFSSFLLCELFLFLFLLIILAIHLFNRLLSHLNYLNPSRLILVNTSDTSLPCTIYYTLPPVLSSSPTCRETCQSGTTVNLEIKSNQIKFPPEPALSPSPHSSGIKKGPPSTHTSEAVSSQHPHISSSVPVFVNHSSDTKKRLF